MTAGSFTRTVFFLPFWSSWLQGCTWTASTFHRVVALRLNNGLSGGDCDWGYLSTVNSLACWINTHQTWLWSQREGRDVQWYSERLWYLNGPEFTKKTSPTPVKPLGVQPELLIQGRMAPCLYQKILTFKCHSRNDDSSDQETFFQPVIVQFWWSLRKCCPSLLLWADSSGSQCIVLLLRG